jgi:hypothetical protein
MKLRLSSDLAVDTDGYKREGLRFSILAMSGHGKSNAAADIVEDVLDNNAQVIIIEPIPEWHTLKAKYNNVVVVGGPYQDLPLEPAFTHEYVKSALEKGISLVVNVSDIEDDADQIKFVSTFLWNLYRLEQKYRRVLFLVLEEADIWAPQNWDAVTKQSLSRVSLIAKHGRKIGIFPILISQRPADLHKSPLSQCNINLFGKFTSPADLSEKTGIMYLVKKLHLSITEEQIMKLQSGYFVVSDKSGVHTVAVRKRLCPHGADTPLIEPKPFTADLSRALGGLRDEISNAIAAKKDEESVVKRLEKENAALRRTNEELAEKANIKLSVKEMMEGNYRVRNAPGELSEDVKRRLSFLGEQVHSKNEEIQSLKTLNERFAKENNAFRKLKEALTEFLPTVLPTEVPTAVGLQKVTKIVALEDVKKHVGAFQTDTVKGKILALSRIGFFGNWKSLSDVQGKLIVDAFTCTDDAVNKALRELVDAGIMGLKHTDRNRWKLSSDVVFEDKKEAEF